jgi:hypothetical protein
VTDGLRRFANAASQSCRDSWCARVGIVAPQKARSFMAVGGLCALMAVSACSSSTNLHPASSHSPSSAPTSDGTVAVPDLLGRSLAKAQLLAAQSALKLVPAGHARSSQPKGAVTTQQPPAGIHVSPGSSVKVTVSSGR